jgi:hypothetical protein
VYPSFYNRSILFPDCPNHDGFTTMFDLFNDNAMDDVMPCLSGGLNPVEELQISIDAIPNGLRFPCRSQKGNFALQVTRILR